MDSQSQANGKRSDAFFSKITSPENVEDALDDVVDGKIQLTAVDRVGLEAYKRRKPGRFKQLKEIARSQPFPPAVVAYYGGALDAQTLRLVKDGLLNAAKKDKGEMLLNLSHLTSFEDVPEDFAQVVARMRKAYPAPNAESK